MPSVTPSSGRLGLKHHSVERRDVENPPVGDQRAKGGTERPRRIVENQATSVATDPPCAGGVAYPRLMGRAAGGDAMADKKEPRTRTRSVRWPTSMIGEIQGYADRHHTTFNDVVVQRCLALRDRRYADPGVEPDPSIFDVLAESRADEAARRSVAREPSGEGDGDDRTMRDQTERRMRSVARSLVAAVDVMIDESRRMTEAADGRGDADSGSARAMQDTLAWLESYELLAEYQVESLRMIGRGAGGGE